MPSVKQQLIADINCCKGASLPTQSIAKKIFLLDPAYAFKENRIVGFQILNSIAERFRVPLGCVKIAGSSQTGFSPFKNRDFVFGESDLDIALVSPPLYQRYCEITYEITNGYVNLTGFKDRSFFDRFEQNLRIGFFRPDLMPVCKQKTDWFVFFNSITNRYSTMFKSINGGVYFSELFFAGKQAATIEKLI